jgi:hypothetical protein
MVAAVSVYAQDRIAVIDTVVPKGMDMGVVIPVTEKIMEEFVRSKLFIVLDRAFISKTLSEQEFSISDLTSGDSKTLATIGGFLQSNYIVVSTVQQLDKTFFLSAKMIEVKSGVIMAQTSVDRTGSIAVLIDMAAELGRKLVTAATGQEVPATSTVKPTQVSPPAQAAEEEKPVSPPPAIVETKTKPARFSSIAGEFGVGTTSAVVDDGDSYGPWDVFSFQYTDTQDPVYGSGSSIGGSGIFTFGLFYASIGTTIVNAENEWYNSLDYEYYTSMTQALDIYAGLGIDIPIGPILLYAGPRIGFSVLSATVYNMDGIEAGYNNVWAGLGFGLEFGADLKLGILDIGVRYGSIVGTLDSLDYDDSVEYSNGALTLRAGIAF